MKFEYIITAQLLATAASCPFASLLGGAGLPADSVHRHLQGRGGGLAPPGGQKPPPPPPQTNPTRAPTAAPTQGDVNLPTKQPSHAPTRPPTAPPTTQTTGCGGPAGCLNTAASLGPPVCAALAGSPFVQPASFCQVYFQVAAEFNAIPLQNRKFLYGPIIRLAFHDAGEADITKPDSLGSDGCMSSDPANAGLTGSCDEVTVVLEPIWQRVCGKITRADFWVLLAKLAIEEAFPAGVDVTIPFAYGRHDATECQGGSGRLPGAAHGLEEIGRVFEVQMGLSEADAVTLIGAHSVGHVCPANSGFGINGAGTPWDDTPDVLDSHFFQQLANLPWNRNDNIAGQYQRPGAIMLNTDMSLAFDIHADDPSFATAAEFSRCQTEIRRADGSVARVGTCGEALHTVYDLVRLYASEETVFANAFATSFEKMVTIGYSTVPGLGNSLTPFDPSFCVA
jgi:hypothetical protein